MFFGSRQRCVGMLFLFSVSLKVLDSVIEQEKETKMQRLERKSETVSIGSQCNYFCRKPQSSNLTRTEKGGGVNVKHKT